MLSFRQLLDYRVLTSAYESRPTRRDYSLTNTYFVSPENVDSDEYRLIYWPSANEPAPMNSRGKEARELTPEGGTEREAMLFYAFNKTPIPMAGLEALREPDSETLDEKGKKAISLTFDRFVERHRIYKELVLAKILTGGIVYVNAAGQVLESSTGAVMTCDFGVGATHKGNLDGKVATLWSDAAALIGDDIEQIKDTAEAEGAETPTEIWLHPLSKNWLRANTQFKEWAKEVQVNVDTILRGDMIPNLWGLNWHFYGAKYKAADGTMKDFIPTTKGFLTPPASSPWLRAANGSTLVPKSLEIQQSVDSALSNIAKVYGNFSYAKLIDDPLQLLMYMGDCFGLNFADPNAIWQPTLFAS